MEQPPRCPYCGRPMQLNTTNTSNTVRQYLCGCRGIVFHKNVVDFGVLKLKEKEA